MGRLVYEDPLCFVVLVDEPRFPGFCRVVVRRHVKEMTELTTQERDHVMDLVFAVEAALLEFVRPDKVNLASLGNVTPHVHWHVIPRWRTDARFPQPIWGEPLRTGEVPLSPQPQDELAVMLQRRLGTSDVSR